MKNKLIMVSIILKLLNKVTNKIITEIIIYINAGLHRLEIFIIYII